MLVNERSTLHKDRNWFCNNHILHLLCVNRKMLRQDVLHNYHITIFVIISVLASSTVDRGYDPSSGQNKRL